ncbi:MAG: T9SS type A sorting domain-containing protein [Candidatus Marinimicrobia bacterium]|nr:T9SS type A sorting domain-containing protein [Candidatus Neomarinimicrobiota bacterium]
MRFIIIHVISIMFVCTSFGQDSIFTYINGDTLTICHYGTERNCAALFTYDVDLTDSLITVTEVDTGDMVWCHCTFDLSVSITGLEFRNYQIDVWGDDLCCDPQLYGSLEVDLSNPGTVGHDESDCLAGSENTSTYMTTGGDTSYIEITVLKDTLNLFWDTPLLNCGFMPIWDGLLRSDTFHVTMVDTGPPTDCVCPFKITASFAPFSPGIYVLDFWDGEYGYPQFTVNGLAKSGAVSILGEYQSECYYPVETSPDKSPEIARLELGQCYPNPFNPATNIRYVLPDQSRVILKVYDIRGQEIITLKRGEQAAGIHEVQWSGLNQSGSPVSAGVYFARLQVEDPATSAFGGVPGGAGYYSKTIKMVYLK